MRCYVLSETLVCIVQHSLVHATFVLNARHVSTPIKRDATISVMALKGPLSDGVPLNPFLLLKVILST